MNNILKREIISHIYKVIGIYADENILKTSMLEPIVGDKFLLNKKIAFETEDKKQKQNNLWAATSRIESSYIKIMAADITEDISEFTIILQMDNFIPCAIRFSLDNEDTGSMFINVENNNWVEASTLMQAKMLVGIESLSEIYLQWERLDDYSSMYKLLVGFLNFYEQD
jgi:hypothetical protein